MIAQTRAELVQYCMDNAIEAGKSDLYVIPRIRTAFRNPMEEIPAEVDMSAAAAVELERDRAICTAHGVFSDAVVDYQIAYLNKIS